MRRFEFGLKTVLKVRRSTEERLKQEYANQTRRLNEEYRKLETLSAQVLASEEEARAAQSNQVDLALERAYCDYLQTLERRLTKTRERIVLLESELKRQQAVLLQARRAVKVLEKLRERRWAEYHKKSQQQEQKNLDDLTMMRHSLTSES
jgi:flagellar FliJ protein